MGRDRNFAINKWRTIRKENVSPPDGATSLLERASFTKELGDFANCLIWEAEVLPKMAKFRKGS